MANLKYFLIRAALFVPLFIVFLLLGTGALLAALYGAVISFAVSYLFFQRQRNEASAQIRHRLSGKAEPVRTATEIDDAAAEDALVDAQLNAAESKTAESKATQNPGAKNADGYTPRTSL
ncbi:DUF4229 domain-containing protein [Pseudarthrobacter sp. J1763]|uniref:DUF4229 domain-containing protein n=1 Tax=Pseudarthrobacter sp. J1763 TaxID=3420445 RepID=UPI003D2878F7